MGKKITKCEFCCCWVCHRGFDRLGEYLGHLSCEGFCRGGADYGVRSIAHAVRLGVMYDANLASRYRFHSMS